jgi:hypothetical protein
MKVIAHREPFGWTLIACTAVVVLGCAVRIKARQPDAPPPTPAVQVRVNTITAFTVPLVGQRVRVVDGLVRRVVSPRLFILSSGGPGVAMSGSRDVAVIVESGSVMVSSGEQIMVTGVVHGFLTQQEDIGRSLIGALTMDERAALGKRPLVIVNSATNLSRR